MADLTGIEKDESPRADLYKGTKDQLIAAGLVRADQFPPSRSYWVTFVDGELLRRRYSYKMDERYLRVERFDAKRGLFRVWVGISLEVQRQRREADRQRAQEAWDRVDRARAAQATAERVKSAEDACQMLARVPRTADQFRRHLVSKVRNMMRTVVDELPRMQRYGYSLAPEALEHVMMSVDAVVEAIMAGEVLFDPAEHAEVISHYQARIVAGTTEVSAKVARVLAPNAALLADEVQP